MVLGMAVVSAPAAMSMAAAAVVIRLAPAFVMVAATAVGWLGGWWRW